jgi:C4-dicarboxylate-specific signal transduction histidine kinase
MKPNADLQLESLARYGRALGHAAANVVHEVNAPLAVALARVQLAIRLLDDLPAEQAAALDEQLRGCEAAIRSSAKVVRDLNYLRDDLVSSNKSASATHVLNAAYQLTLLDATHAGCELTIQLPVQEVPFAGHPQHLLVLLLELIWGRIRQDARHIAVELETASADEGTSPRIVVVSDLHECCDDATQSWLESIALICKTSISWRSGRRGTACVIALNVDNQVNSLLQGAI